MNNFTFGFTTDEEAAGYDSAAQKFTIHLTQEILDETDAETQDAMVKAAIDAAIAYAWENDLPALFREVDPPEVTLTAGLGAQAVADAATGGETAIKTDVDGATMGKDITPAVPDEVINTTSTLASAVGLNVNSASARASGTSLNRQIISYNTPLSEWNAGAGVNLAGGRITITDSQMRANPSTDAEERRRQPEIPNSWTLVIDPNRHKTVGDIIDAINGLSSLNVFASINATGDGIIIEDRTPEANSRGTFSISDTDANSKFAASMGIAGSVSQSQKTAADGVAAITSSVTHQIEVVETDSLNDIRQKINDLNAGYTATILVDGSNTPYRLSISGKSTGAAGAFNIDLSALGLTTENLTEAQDAKIAYGNANASTGLVLSSATNTFKGIINGIDLTITGVSDTPVTISCDSTSMDVKVRLQSFVDNYNNFREFLNKQMNYTITSSGIMVAEDGGTLWNSSIARAFDRDVNNLLQRRVEGIPGIYSLADLGITIRQNYNDVNEGIGGNSSTNTLHFDEDKFQAAWDRDPEAVEKFFFDEREYTDSSGKTTKVNYGWAQKFADLTDSLCGRADELGKVQSRIDTLTQTIDRNEQRVAYLEERLEWKRNMYLKQFYAMEQAMARMTSDMSAVTNIATSWAQNYSSGG
jgi:flagellar hook-associated protein 2